MLDGRARPCIRAREAGSSPKGGSAAAPPGCCLWVLPAGVADVLDGSGCRRMVVDRALFRLALDRGARMFSVAAVEQCDLLGGELSGATTCQTAEQVVTLATDGQRWMPPIEDVLDPVLGRMQVPPMIVVIPDGMSRFAYVQ